MKEDFEELYNLLSADRPKVRNIKDDYEKEISLTKKYKNQSIGVLSYAIKVQISIISYLN